MDIRSACLQAASHIERYPEEFVWLSCSVPSGLNCGTPGCALSWVSFFLGLGKGGDFRKLQKVLGIERDMEFYRQMDAASGDYEWQRTAPRTAAALRAYAAKYHAPALRTDSELVADLMARVCGERIPEEA